MTATEAAQKLLPFIQAIAEGKTVLWVSHPHHDPVSLAFLSQHPAYDYRIQSEPRDFWLWQCPVHRPTPKVLGEPANGQCDDCEIIHVREVMEEKKPQQNPAHVPNCLCLECAEIRDGLRRVCKQCGKSFYTRDGTRNVCLNCLAVEAPTTNVPVKGCDCPDCKNA